MLEKEEMSSFKHLLSKMGYDINQKLIPWKFCNMIIALRISANISRLPYNCLQKQEHCNTSAAVFLQYCRKVG